MTPTTDPSHTSTRLPPPPVLLQIALYVNDASSLLSFLDALGASVRHSPILNSLSYLVQNHDGIWPCICLTRQLFETAAPLKHVLIVLPHFAHVHVSWAGAMAWLGNLSRSTSITWTASLPNDASKSWFAQWAQLPVTELALRVEGNKPTRRLFYQTLIHCHSLVRMKLGGRVDLLSIFKLAAASTKLVEVHLVGGRTVPIMTTGCLGYAIRWLESTTPVQILTLTRWRWANDVDEQVRAAFYTALLGCATLHNLSFQECSLPHLQVVAPIATRHFKLGKVWLTPLNLTGIARALPESAVHNLVMTDIYRYPDFTDAEYLKAFEQLFEALTISNVHTLTLDRCQLGDVSWPTLATWLQQLKLQQLSLGGNGISDDGAILIALAISASAAIENVDLAHNRIGMKGAMALVNSWRTTRCFKVHFHENAISSEDEALLVAATQRGISLSFCLP
ncbi:Aste57867_7310 [Aphanomyces stellatus]|uniref:Aste57867_7310 protein n=1 Tax=Aphanomyces stellatus TaxID=120398 RepID=A0A485KI58_9STRA|nr:hypothetical protein As57867_007284 [Aphanomyces stellatus]VFT84229.1 Aste57867_7310 [Aphanomyces stellatus]